MKFSKFKRQAKTVAVQHFFLRSTDVDRSVGGFGMIKKGVWAEVPKRVYDDFVNVINAKKIAGEKCSWEVKVTAELLEV